MKGIILSAGQGKRLLPHTSDRPKCLVEAGGRPILEWQLDVLLAGGIDDIVVVTGFMHERVEGLVANGYAEKGVRTLYNPDYAVSDNLVSCFKASKEMDRDFILLNGDTLFEPAVLATLLQEADAPVNITISRKQEYDADDMKVIHDGDRLLRVGKDLNLEEVNGESIGLLCFRAEGPAMFRQALQEALERPEARGRWYLSVIDTLAASGMVKVVSVEGMAWCEIDFPEDLANASQITRVIEKGLSG